MSIVTNGKVGRVITNVNGTMTIRDGKVYVNGSLVEHLPKDQPEIIIEVIGDVERLDVEHCESIHIKGNAKRVKTGYGTITVDGNIDGDAHTNFGDIRCKRIEGDARTNFGNVYK